MVNIFCTCGTQMEAFAGDKDGLQLMYSCPECKTGAMVTPSEVHLVPKRCTQCGEIVVPGEDYCFKCITEDAITMGVVE